MIRHSVTSKTPHDAAPVLFLSSHHPLPPALPFQAHLAHHRTRQRASHTRAWCLHFLPHVLLPPCPSESVSNVTLLRKPLLMNLFKMAFSYPSLVAFNSNFLLRIFYDLDFLFVYCSPQSPYRFNICPMKEGYLLPCFLA